MISDHGRLAYMSMNLGLRNEKKYNVLHFFFFSLSDDFIRSFIFPATRENFSLDELPGS